ncbi:MAG TPA: phosphatidylinositol mannoside acyltransferase [Jatrophihabitantaceae bacterium]|jgi:KDO2-lipid IV(A) lauroyltransferase
MLDRVRGRAVDLGYAAGWGLVKSAPSGLARRSFAAVADAASVRNGKGAQQLRKNLRRVVGPDMPEPELDELVGAGLRSYARYWLETFRLPKMDKRAVVEATEVNTEGIANIDEALERGRGAVLVLPHTGNWDVAGLWLVAHSGPFATVAERLKPDSLFDRFVEYRESLGFEILPLTGGARTPLDVLRERLRENKVICLLGDRDLSRNGVPVDFFGEPTRMPGGPAVLAATTGAALMPVGLWYTDDGGWGQVIQAPLEIPEGRLRDQVPTVTQSLAHSFEKMIAAHPADWHMLQKLWLSDLPPRPKPG